METMGTYTPIGWRISPSKGFPSRKFPRLEVTESMLQEMKNDSKKQAE